MFECPFFSFSMVLQPFRPWPIFSLMIYTVRMTPWTGDQLVARPVPTHRTTQTQNKGTHIHAWSGIRTHDPSVRANEDGSYLTTVRPLIGMLKCNSANINVILPPLLLYVFYWQSSFLTDSRVYVLTFNRYIFVPWITNLCAYSNHLYKLFLFNIHIPNTCPKSFR
jgi:hypothetical protein